MERDYQEVYKKFSNNALKRGPGRQRELRYTDGGKKNIENCDRLMRKRETG
jgi:hypothetical protein